MDFNTRFATLNDECGILSLYQTVAQQGGGIARQSSEITPAYITHNLTKSIENGICLVVEKQGEIIAEIHSYGLEPKVFKHILSELTLVVSPQFQGMGLGKLIFTAFLAHISNNRHDILRVELIARESNNKAIELYKKIGFIVEGRFEKRINDATDYLEADIPMAWFNPNFNKIG
jgi:ribosomal protein S18 acetylase RimI-like enzyme